MDIEDPTANGNQIQSLKNLLIEILHKNSAYDCMPINSSINSVDKKISLYQAVNILINKDLEELLIWDAEKAKWIWMLTLVDAIRFITHALKSFFRHGSVDFSDFQIEKEEKKGLMVSMISRCSQTQLEELIEQLQTKQIHTIIEEIQNNPPTKDYIRLKSLPKQAKISYLILTMSVQKIHRILVEDPDTHMIISILNFKDIFLYILRIANESPIEYYGTIDIQSLLDKVQHKNIEIDESKPLWEAFEIMTDRDKSLWINVVDKDKKFKGMLFRQDFRGIFQGWHIDYLFMSVGDFIKWKVSNSTGNVPQFRYFQPTEYTRNILWKMAMSTRNAIVCLDQNHEVKATIGLMQIFRLYVN